MVENFVVVYATGKRGKRFEFLSDALRWAESEAAILRAAVSVEEIGR